MPNSSPPTLLELKKCKKVIACQMRDLLKQSPAKEIVTLQAALDHINQLINEFKLPENEKSRSTSKISKKSAA